jgi:hypothetical protein
MSAFDRFEESASASRGRHAFYVQPFAAFLAFVMALPPHVAAQTPVAQNAVNPAPRIQIAAPLSTPATPIQPTPAPAVAVIQASAPTIAVAAAPTPRAALPSNCVWNGGNFIIQYICAGNTLTGNTPPDSSLIAAIQQFEQDSVTQWLAIYNLPNSSTDVQSFYTYARTSTRNSVRAYIELRLVDIAFRLENGQNKLTDNETTVYSWFQGRVQARIVQMDQDAVNNKNNWQSNRCTWQPDPTLEKAYGFTYIPCVGTEIFDTAPSADYFIAAAFQQDFSNVILNLKAANSPVLPASRGRSSASQAQASGSQQPTPSATSLVNGTDDAKTQLIGIAGGASAGVLGVAGATFGLLATTVPSIRKALLPNRSRGDRIKELRSNAKNKNDDANQRLKQNAQDSEDEASTEGDTTVETDATTIVSEASDEDAALEMNAIGAEDAGEIGDSAVGGPPGVAVGLVIALVTTIVTIIAGEAVAEKSLSGLDSSLSNDSANAPDLYKLVQTDTGAAQFDDCFIETTWPDVPSTAPIPAPGVGSSVVVSNVNGSSSYIVNSLNYTDWGGATVTLVGDNGWLIENSSYTFPSGVNVLAGVSNPVLAADLNPTIRYNNWNGDNYWASRIGNGFVVGKRYIADSDVACPAGPSGITELPDLTNCSSYVGNQVQMLDSNGKQVLMSIATRPVISPVSTGIAFNTIESPLTVTIPISGWPLPNVSVDPGTPLGPSGIVMNSAIPGLPGNETVSFTLQGNGVTPGTYNITLHATNPAQDTTLGFTFTITGPDFAAPPTWDSSVNSMDNPAWTTGVFFLTYFHATSAYQLTYASNLILPQGTTFVANSGSNALGIGGTPSPTSGGPAKTTDGQEPYIQACDGLNRCTSHFFNFTVNQAPAAHFTVADFPLQMDFPVGQMRSYTLQTAGAITPVSFYYNPSPGCFAPFPSWITMTDNGNGTVTFLGEAPATDNGSSSVFEANVVIHTQGVVDAPCHTNNVNVFQNSTPQLFVPNATITADGHGYGQFLTSNITPGIGNITTTSPLPNGMTFSPPNGINNIWSIGGTPQPGSGGQYNIALQMQSASETGPVTQNFILTVNEAATFNLPSTIYMMAGISSQYIVKPGGFPTYNAMSVTKSGVLPQGIGYSSGTEINANTGRGILSGTPDPSAATQSYPLTFTANNGVGNPATQGTVLHILLAGDVTHDDKVDCNDVALVKAHFGAKAGTSNYLGAADVNNDGVINLLDLNFVTAHLPQGTSCH